jgi:hypothetical protein
MTNGNKMSILGQTVNYHKNCCLTMRTQQALNKIHRNILPYSFWNWKRLQQLLGREIFTLVSLAYVTMFDKLLNSILYSLPIKFARTLWKVLWYPSRKPLCVCSKIGERRAEFSGRYIQSL